MFFFLGQKSELLYKNHEKTEILLNDFRITDELSEKIILPLQFIVVF